MYTYLCVYVCAYGCTATDFHFIVSFDNGGIRLIIIFLTFLPLHINQSSLLIHLDDN